MLAHNPKILNILNVLAALLANVLKCIRSQNTANKFFLFLLLFNVIAWSDALSVLSDSEELSSRSSVTVTNEAICDDLTEIKKQDPRQFQSSYAANALFSTSSFNSLDLEIGVDSNYAFVQSSESNSNLFLSPSLNLNKNVLGFGLRGPPFA